MGGRLSRALFANPPVYNDCLFMDYSELVAKVDSTSDMLDYVNLVLLGGRLPASVKATYLSAVEDRLSSNYAGLTPEQLKTRKREHSRKPDEQYALITSCSPGPYLEMFARGDRPGWSIWGDQAHDEYSPDWPTYAHHSQRDRLPLFAEI